MQRRARKLVATLFGVAAIAALASPSGALAASPCTNYASPSGSDSASGSEGNPFRSAQRLVDSLDPGEVGCLRAGAYDGVDIRRGGQPGAPITLRSYPGERATVTGRFWVVKTAPHLVIEGLYLNGRNDTLHPSPTINAPDVTFRANDVSNDHTAICFLLGDSHGYYGRADDAVIERNRIHDCGVLPAAGHDHGIYVEATSGARIEGNWLYDNADYGIQLYPNGDRNLIRGNVIDGNGMGITISGDSGQSSDDNRVEGNVISNSSQRFNVEAWWPNGNPVPSAVVSRNCLKAGPRDNYHNGGIDMEVSEAFSLDANQAVSDPGFANRGALDFRLPQGSACRSLYAGDPEAVPGPDGLPAAPAPQPPTDAGPGSDPQPAPTEALRPRPRSTPQAPRPKLAPQPAPKRHSRRSRQRRRARVLLFVVPLRAPGAAALARPMVKLAGMVRGRGRRAGRRVLVQVRTGARWRTVFAARTRGNGRFAARWRVVGPAGARAVRLRAAAPGRGLSRTVTVSAGG
jgi:parallel beta-helix repeat protein